MQITARWPAGFMKNPCGAVNLEKSLGDGTILTTYGNYRNAGALILWKP